MSFTDLDDAEAELLMQHGAGTLTNVECEDCGADTSLCGCDGLWEDDEDEGFQMSDVEADADTLASAGYGTDEDYGLIGGDSDLYGEW